MMKLAELTRELQKALAQHGDIDVCILANKSRLKFVRNLSYASREFTGSVEFIGIHAEIGEFQQETKL